MHSSFPSKMFEEIIVHRKMASQLTSLLLMTIGSVPLFAQQFAADLVHLKPKGAAPARVMVRGDKIRFETGLPSRVSILVVDLTQETGFMALPESKSYSVIKPGRIPSVMPFFHPADPENACAAWEKMTGKPGSCMKIGDETVQGRAAVKYKGTTRNGDTGLVWIDRKLRFVTKWEGQAAAAEFRNIREEPQPVALFEIPKGYDLLNSQAARQQVRKPAVRTTRPATQKPNNF